MPFIYTLVDACIGDAGPTFPDHCHSNIAQQCGFVKLIFMHRWLNTGSGRFGIRIAGRKFMTNISKSLGNQGEKLAGKYLEEQGYKILNRNYRSGRGELDLVCSNDGDLIVVEVKSVRSPLWGSGEERISRAKQRMIIRTTYAFLDRHPQYTGMGVRFDVIIVNFIEHPAQISHYCGAFWESL